VGRGKEEGRVAKDAEQLKSRLKALRGHEALLRGLGSPLTVVVICHIS
jgi:hypothetical protein